MNTLPANMLSKIEFTDTCWNWTGAVQSRGYGSMTNGRGGTMQVHRRAYMELVGPIPEGLTIDHLCRNRLCVNPAHLEPVTGAENTRRALAHRTHCKHGHPLSGENLRMVHTGGYDRRVCITCSRECRRDYMRAHREAMRETFALRARPDLRAAIRVARLTVAEVAARVGLSQQSLSRRLSGESPFADAELALLESLAFPTTPVPDAPQPGTGVLLSSGLAPEPDQPKRSTL